MEQKPGVRQRGAGTAHGVLGWLVPACENQLLTSLPNSMFTDVTLVTQNWPWWSSHVTEIGKRYKSGFCLPKSLLFNI